MPSSRLVRTLFCCSPWRRRLAKRMARLWRSHPIIAMLTTASEPWPPFGGLHAAGYPMDFSKLYPTGRCVSLPTYPWQRERHWLETPAAIKPADSASDHLYELRWRRIPEPTGAVRARRVLVIGEGHDAETLRNELRSAGCEVILTNEGPDRINDVVHLLPEELAAQCLIRTVQLLAADQGGPAPRLWVVTSGALPVEHPNGRLRISSRPSLVWPGQSAASIPNFSAATWTSRKTFRWPHV